MRLGCHQRFGDASVRFKRCPVSARRQPRPSQHLLTCRVNPKIRARGRRVSVEPELADFNGGQSRNGSNRSRAARLYTGAAPARLAGRSPDGHQKCSACHVCRGTGKSDQQQRLAESRPCKPHMNGARNTTGNERQTGQIKTISLTKATWTQRETRSCSTPATPEVDRAPGSNLTPRRLAKDDAPSTDAPAKRARREGRGSEAAQPGGERKG